LYLAVILDGFSRKVVGWSLERSLASRLAMAALEQAIAARQVSVGLVHHSDRGVQYASAEYAAVLEKHGMIPSMSRPANPYDNASCESFLKTLKREEIYANQYSDLEHLRTNIEEFIEKYYNRQRLHSALGYCSPEEFEQHAQHSDSMTQFRSPTVKFFEAQRRKILRGCWSRGLKRRPLLQTSSPAKQCTTRTQSNGTCVIQICLISGVHPTPIPASSVPTVCRKVCQPTPWIRTWQRPAE